MRVEDPELSDTDTTEHELRDNLDRAINAYFAYRNEPGTYVTSWLVLAEAEDIDDPDAGIILTERNATLMQAIGVAHTYLTIAGREMHDESEQ